MKLEIKATDIQKIAKTLQSFSDEATITLTKEKLTAIGIDPSHVGLVHIELNKNRKGLKFNSDESKLTFDTKEFSTALSVFSGFQTLTLTVKKEKIVVTQDKDLGHKQTELRLFDTAKDTPLPKVPLDVKAMFSAPDCFNKAVIDNFAKFGETIDLIAKEGQRFKGIAVGDSMKFEDEIGLKDDTKGEGKASYSIQYIQDFCKTCNPNQLEFSTKKPLKLSEIISEMDEQDEREIEQGFYTLFLAPKVET